MRAGEGGENKRQRQRQTHTHTHRERERERERLGLKLELRRMSCQNFSLREKEAAQKRQQETESKGGENKTVELE